MLRDTATGKTVLNRETERLFIELGGTKTNKQMSAEQLADAAASSVVALADMGDIHVLERIYNIARTIKPEMPSLGELKERAREEAEASAEQRHWPALRSMK